MNENEIIKSVRTLDREKIKKILLFKGEEKETLFKIARKVRDEGIFQNKVELRSVIELSNICSQKCRYCSMNQSENKYILKKEVVLDKIKALFDMGRKTFLLQSGEYSNQKYIDDVSEICEKSKALYPDIRLILCLGNLSDEQYIQLKESGASRYILKFETSNKEHHKFCRPTDTIENRLNRIQKLIDIGFLTGSGNITGLPKQTLDNLADDLILINKLNLSMVSSTKFIPNEHSDFASYPQGDVGLTLNFIAILRILKPNCLIPSTSSLSTGTKNGQINGLYAGCNTLTVHDGTPKEFEKSYQIYSKNRFSPLEKHLRDIAESAGMVVENYLM